MIVDEAVYLEHYGVKGMRWGVIRRRNRSDIHTSTSDDAKKAYAHRGKPLHSLSNQDLKELNDRINLEQNFRRLNPTKIQKGQKHLKEVMGTIGVGISAYKFLNSGAGVATVAAGKLAIGKNPNAARKRVAAVRKLANK